MTKIVSRRTKDFENEINCQNSFLLMKILLELENATMKVSDVLCSVIIHIFLLTYNPVSTFAFRT